MSIAPATLQLVPPMAPFSAPRDTPAAPEADLPEVAVRFAVRLDWRSPAVMVAIAHAFATTFAEHDPVELLLVVDGVATRMHAEQGSVLMDAVAADDGRYAPVVVVGRDEIGGVRIDGGTLEAADGVRSGIELVRTLEAMRELGRALRSGA